MVVAGLVAVVGSNDWSKWFETVRLIPVISVCVITTPVPPDRVLASSHQSEHSTSKRQDRSLSPVLCVSCANVDISSSPSPTIAKGSNCIRSLTCRAPEPEPGCRPVNPKLRPFALLSFFLFHIYNTVWVVCIVCVCVSDSVLMRYSDSKNLQLRIQLDLPPIVM